MRNPDVISENYNMSEREKDMLEEIMCAVIQYFTFG
jgi:hypothetical protein